MANKKITELTNLATPAGADIMAIVDDVAGTPTTKKVTATNLMTLAPVQSVNGDTGAVTVSGLSLSTTSPTASGTPLAYTLTSAEDGKVVLFNETNNVYVTVPTGLGSGFNCKFVQLGAGKIVLQAGSGLTLNSYKTGTEIRNTTIGQYAEIELIPVGTDSFVVVGNSTTAPFLNSYSLSLDGTDDEVECGNLGGALSSASVFTVSAWIKTSTVGGVIFSGSGNDYLRVNATSPRMAIAGTAKNLGSVNYADGNWHQLTFTFNSGTGTLYSDGNSTAVGSDATFPTSTASWSYNTYGFSIGYVSQSNANYFNGVIDEVAIWSSALSSSEIPDIQASNAPIDLRSDNGNYTSSSNLIHYWRMGDNNGGSGTTVTDLVGSYDGTLNNGASFGTDTP